jgi:hypothetical protein
MPLVDGKELTPDEAIADGLCPECAAPLDEESAQAHMEMHYVTAAHGQAPNIEANRRAELVRARYSKTTEVKE